MANKPVEEVGMPGIFFFPVPENVAATLCKIGGKNSLTAAISEIRLLLHDNSMAARDALIDKGKDIIRNTALEICLWYPALDVSLYHHCVIDDVDVLAFDSNVHIPDFEGVFALFHFKLRGSALPAYITHNGRKYATQSDRITLQPEFYKPQINGDISATGSNGEITIRAERIFFEMPLHRVFDWDWQIGRVVLEFEQAFSSGKGQTVISSTPGESPN